MAQIRLGPKAVMMDVKLISVTSKGICKSFSLNGPMMTLGRGPECDLQIPLGKISRQHCQLQVNEDKVFVRDMQSANGSYVNSERITHQELNAGDIIAMADAVKFMVQIDGLPSKIDEEALSMDSPVGLPKSDKERDKEKALLMDSQIGEPVLDKPKSPAPADEDFDLSDSNPDDILGESFFMDMDDED